MGASLSAVARYVAIYCRLSPRPDGSYEGVDVQEKLGRQYAANAWPGVPVKVFADAGISAATGERRPSYEELRAAIARGEVVGLWAVEQTRLERREVGWFELAAELDAAGITEVHTNRDGIVRVRDEVAGIKAVLAAAEVRKLRNRVNDRLDAIAADGRPSAASVFGYRRGVDETGGKTLVVVPDEAAVVRETAERVLAGWSLERIAADLRDRGLTGAHGGKITGSTVKLMVTNHVVAGWRVHRGQQLRRGVWPAILGEDTWNAVRDKLSAPRVVRQANGVTYPVPGRRVAPARRYLLTGGTARCSVCGAPMIATMKQLTKVKGGRREVWRVAPYYQCHPKTGGKACVGIMGEPFEAYAARRLLDELDKPAFRQALADDGTAAVRDAITGKLRAVEGRRKKLARLWAADDLTDEEWDTARAELAEREAQLRLELAAVPAPIARVDLDLIREAWPAMNLDERRELVAMFIETVTVKRAKPGSKGFDEGRVEIVWRTR